MLRPEDDGLTVVTIEILYLDGIQLGPVSIARLFEHQAVQVVWAVGDVPVVGIHDDAVSFAAQTMQGLEHHQGVTKVRRVRRILTISKAGPVRLTGGVGVDECYPWKMRSKNVQGKRQQSHHGHESNAS